MKFIPTEPPRIFSVGHQHPIDLKDCAHIKLEADEQVTFVTDSGAEYDVVQKSWGFYATPSLNRRLPKCGFRAALVKSPDGRFYIMLVERGQEEAFDQYLAIERQIVVFWLHSDKQLETLKQKLWRP